MQPILIALGDRYGIGPELLTRVVADPQFAGAHEICLVGDWRCYEDCVNRLNTVQVVNRITKLSEFDGRGPSFLDIPFEAPVGPLGKVAKISGEESLAVLQLAADAIRNDAIAGFVYAPLNKESLREAGHASGDELDYLKQIDPSFGEASPINLLDGLWNGRVTNHVALRQVADLITIEAVKTATDKLVTTMTRAGEKDIRIAVAGLNPHSGENGLIGREEIDVIGPAIDIMREKGLDVFGPVPPDTLVPQARLRNANGLLTMFHDQGQIALKLLGLGKSVTFIGGLPVPVATPGHGTAFDITGKGVARLDSMKSAIDLCRRMAQSG